MSARRPAEHAVRIRVVAKPNAKTSRVVRAERLEVHVALAAPPVDGAANDELVAVLAGVLSVPKRSVRLLRGAGSKQKVVEVVGLGEGDVIERLARAVG